jgi:hypothetical protein
VGSLVFKFQIGGVGRSRSRRRERLGLEYSRKLERKKVFKTYSILTVLDVLSLNFKDLGIR